VYQMNDTDKNTPLSVAVYGNLSSLASQTTFGSIMLQQIARFYTNEENLKISFTNAPLEPNLNAIAADSPDALTLYVNCVFAALWINGMVIIHVISERFDNFTYDTLMFKSGSVYTYFFTRYILDLIVHIWASACLLILPVCFGLHFDGFILPCALWALCNPLFMYAMTFLLVRDYKHHKKWLFGLYCAGMSNGLALINYSLPHWGTSLKIHDTLIGVCTFYFWLPSFDLTMSLVAI